MGNFKFLKSVLYSTLVVVFLCGCGKDTAKYVSVESIEEKETEMVSTESSTEASESETETEQKSVYVYVCGAVNHPGVYTLPEGSRVCDVFQLAGGLTEQASPDYWNQASLLKDGDMIYVPTMEQASERVWLDTEGKGSDEDNADGKININTASKEVLMTIPGIGESKANAIIKYRESNGAFSTIEDVKNVEGIKDGVYTKMKEYIVIN